MTISQHARIHNGDQHDLLLGHIGGKYGSRELVYLRSDDVEDEIVYISPDALPDLIEQLQGILKFLSGTTHQRRY
jgi:hypothetical protein